MTHSPSGNDDPAIGPLSADSRPAPGPATAPNPAPGPLDFLRSDAVGGILMLAATVAALLWANLGSQSYTGVRTFVLGPMDIGHWATSGVLTIFFFIAGLELKKEFVRGSLAEPRNAVLPIVAAVCGMAVPAGIYLLVNLIGSGDLRGWAVPMATDIAFAMAVLAVFGSRLPASLRAFLLTLAIVDDLGAIIVIALVFTANLSLLWLAGAIACMVAWWLGQRWRITGWYVYLPLGLLCWWCMYASGVHATIAGVAVGLLTRARADQGEIAPVDRWSHRWHPISAGFAVPVFALFAAGVVLDPATLAGLATDPVAIGIVIGLIIGKPLGIVGGAWLTARLTSASLAEDLRWSELFWAAILAGIGFTVAIFITELSFAGDPGLIDAAKLSVLTASTLAGILAAIGLTHATRVRQRAAPLKH